MSTKIAAVLLFIALAGGGYAGWKLNSELGRLRVELADARSAAEKSRAEAAAAKSRADELGKQIDEQKIQVAALAAERDSARMLQQSAQRQSERLLQDLELAQQQVAYLRARSGAPSQFSPPQVMRPQQPMIIQALPAPRPQGAAVAAPVPGQGYGPVQQQQVYPR